MNIIINTRLDDRGKAVITTDVPSDMTLSTHTAHTVNGYTVYIETSMNIDINNSEFNATLTRVVNSLIALDDEWNSLEHTEKFRQQGHIEAARKDLITQLNQAVWNYKPVEPMTEPDEKELADEYPVSSVNRYMVSYHGSQRVPSSITYEDYHQPTLTVAEFAERAGVTPNTIYRILRDPLRRKCLLLGSYHTNPENPRRGEWRIPEDCIYRHIRTK